MTPVARNRIWPLVAVLALLFLVNLPLGHAMWTDHRLDQDGEQGTALVVRTDTIGADERRFVVYRLSEELDADQHEFTTEVDPATFDRAEQTGELAVTYLPDQPTTNRADGRVSPGRLGLVITLAADLALVAVATLLLWGRRRHGELRLTATADVVRCRPDDVVEELADDEFLVRGEVLEVADDEVVLVSSGRRVRVELGEHVNPVGHQQPAQVRGRRTS